MAPKLLIVVAVVLVVLFVVGLGLGASHTGPPTTNDRNTNWAMNLDRLLASPRPMEARDVAQTCLGQADCLIQTGAPISIQIGNGVDRVRQAHLHLAAGPSLVAALEQKGTFTQTKTIVTGGTETLDIYQSGGTLALSCVPVAVTPGPCHVSLSS